MPLIKSDSKEAFSKNVAELMHSNPNRDQKQAIAIGYSVQREAERRAHEKSKSGK